MRLDNDNLNINCSSTSKQLIPSLQLMQKAEWEMCLFQPQKYFYFLEVSFGLIIDKQKEMHCHK